MAMDRIGTSDTTEAGLSRTPTAAKHPCHECGRETKEHKPDADGNPRRICSMPLCAARIAMLKTP